jgi:hypothetical protein
MEYNAGTLIETYQQSGGSALYQRRLGTWSGSAWSYGAWTNCP